jgi:hypothetical protein
MSQALRSPTRPPDRLNVGWSELRNRLSHIAFGRTSGSRHSDRCRREVYVLDQPRSDTLELITWSSFAWRCSRDISVPPVDPTATLAGVK